MHSVARASLGVLQTKAFPRTALDLALSFRPPARHSDAVRGCGTRYPMSPPDQFVPYARLSDQLIERASKEQLADVARLLAINIGWYQRKYGDVPQDTLLKLVQTETLDEDTLTLLSAGMQNLVSALLEVTGLTDELQDESRH